MEVEWKSRKGEEMKREEGDDGLVEWATEQGRNRERDVRVLQYIVAEA